MKTAKIKSTQWLHDRIATLEADIKQHDLNHRTATALDNKFDVGLQIGCGNTMRLWLADLRRIAKEAEHATRQS